MAYAIIRDNREHEGKGWAWRKNGPFDGMMAGTLKTGDYSIYGLEDVITLERKAAPTEIAQNYLEDRFWREIERLKLIRFAYIIFEFNLPQLLSYPYGNHLPNYLTKKIRIKGDFLLKKTTEIQIYHKIPVIFAGTKGKEMATAIFKRSLEVIEAERKEALSGTTRSEDVEI